VLQQSPKSAGDDRRFSPEGLHLVSISVHLIIFGIAWGEGAFRWSCLLCHGPPVVATPQPTSPESLGSQEPPALSQKVPLLVMPLVVCQAGTLEAAAHSEVPADRWVDGQCSRVRCGGYKLSNI
jgi:hypothetical protein